MLAASLAGPGGSARSGVTLGSQFAKRPPLALRKTYLYSLWAENRIDGSPGEFLKWGISWAPAHRYAQWFLRGKFMRIEAHGTRPEILRLERSLTERAPGNLES
jgi:hypothetical protein